ncbi:MAG: SPFH domain-containing protein [Oscillospiraceae bacterium]|jgi:membrane protease subunit (stomatin/prohibitin family)|nr:SPFH domain-containing protein [Oscillospiraceae bacterium]
MGLIKAAIGAAGGTLADQWKEYFVCDALDANTLLARGQKQSGKRSSNTKGSDNVITTGSGIQVSAGQCALIADGGRVTEVCAEPGVYTFDAFSEPSIFSGDLVQGIDDLFHTALRRFSYGGDTARDQRVYYINTKELLDNKFGTQNPVPFRIVDRNIGLDIDISVRCNGVYTFRVGNPLLFFTNVSGNVEGAFTRDRLAETMRTELLQALQPALSRISALQIRPNELPGHSAEMRDALRTELAPVWFAGRGLELLSVNFNSVTIPAEDEELIKQAQRTAMLQNPTYAAATLAGAQADAMRTAAGNAAGAMTGFMGMGFAQQAGGADPATLFGMGAPATSAPSAPPPAPTPTGDAWRCACGSVNTGNFCGSCGQPKPVVSAAKCALCGWTNAPGQAVPNFCPNCGAKL